MARNSAASSRVEKHCSKQALSRLRAFPRLNAEARRAEVFVARRLAQRFVAGVRHTSCTEMHYSPKSKPKRDPSPTTVFLCSAHPLPLLRVLELPSPSRGPSRPGQWRPLRLAPSCNEPGTPVAFKLAKSADGLYYTPLLAESSFVRAALAGLIILEAVIILDTVTLLEGTSEASLAASVPRVSTDALPTQEPGPGP